MRVLKDDDQLSTLAIRLTRVTAEVRFDREGVTLYQGQQLLRVVVAHADGASVLIDEHTSAVATVDEDGVEDLPLSVELPALIRERDAFTTRQGEFCAIVFALDDPARGHLVGLQIGVEDVQDGLSTWSEVGPYGLQKRAHLRVALKRLKHPKGRDDEVKALA